MDLSRARKIKHERRQLQTLQNANHIRGFGPTAPSINALHGPPASEVGNGFFDLLYFVASKLFSSR